jgi:transcriptional regulator with XRE-family HTH domain
LGDAEDFLQLSDEERQAVELRANLSRTIRKRREAQQLTQAQLARKLKSSQSRVAKIEAGGVGVSLDLMFKTLFALGGRLSDIAAGRRPSKPRRRAVG